jgi:hypothetical protein
MLLAVNRRILLDRQRDDDSSIGVGFDARSRHSTTYVQQSRQLRALVSGQRWGGVDHPANIVVNLSRIARRHDTDHTPTPQVRHLGAEAYFTYALVGPAQILQVRRG